MLPSLSPFPAGTCGWGVTWEMWRNLHVSYIALFALPSPAFAAGNMASPSHWASGAGGRSCVAGAWVLCRPCADACCHPWILVKRPPPLQLHLGTLACLTSRWVFSARQHPPWVAGTCWLLSQHHRAVWRGTMRLP